jgi:hypothetical protein
MCQTPPLTQDLCALIGFVAMDDPQHLPPKPVFPEDITAASVAEYKAQCRVWDAARIKFGVATPEQVQRENPVIPKAQNSRILRFSKHS